MRIILSDFISLDGVVQAPGGKKEDTDGGFENGGWSMRYFDPEAMGSAIDEVMQSTEALLFGIRGLSGSAFSRSTTPSTQFSASRPARYQSTGTNGLAI
jgi:hypothetical protein